MPTEEQMAQLERLDRMACSDAFTKAIRILHDAVVRGEFADNPQSWYDIEEIVIPALESERRKFWPE